VIPAGAWLGLRLARTPDQRHLWRRWSIVSGSAVLTIALLVGWAVIADAHAAADRGMARRPILADSGTSPLRIVLRAATWQGRQIPVVWVDAQPGAPVPPGIDAWPAPGQAAVSPAVAADADLLRGLGLQIDSVGTGVRGTIGAAGLVSPSERLIYQAMPPGRSLEFGRGFPIAGFGPANEETPQLSFDTDSPTPPPATVTVLVAWLLLVPASMLALSAARAMSEVRVERTRVLRQLGLGPAQLLGVNAAETLALAAPSSSVSAACLWALGPHIDARLGELSLSQGALGIGTTAAVLAVVLVVAFFAAAGAPITTQPTAGRAGATMDQPRWWFTAPLAVAAAGMLIARALYIPLLLLMALALMTVALPMAVPWLVGRLASVGEHTRRVTIWLACRRLAASPTRFARPAVAVGVLLFVVISWAGTYLNAVTSQLNEPNATTDRTYFSVTWRDPGEADLATASRALSASVIAPIDLNSDPPTAVFGTCDEVLEFLPEASCADGLTPDLEQEFGARFGVLPRIGDAPPEPWGLAALVVAAPAGTSYTDLAGRLGTSFPALNIEQLGHVRLAPPFLASWLWLLGSIATILLLLTAVHTFGNRVLALAPEDARLATAGADLRQITAIQRWSVVAPLLVSISLGTTAGLAYQVVAAPLDQAAITVTAAITLAGLAALISAAAAATVLRKPRMERSEVVVQRWAVEANVEV
jgi:hypothetical protein